MIVIPSYRGPIYAAFGGVTGPPPTFRSTVYVFNLFSDTEMIVNRYDSTTASVTTTARGWFFR